ncbi:MAG TPA: PspC domain-containing protein [Candidatus Magasanikbacteria bacterium]|nr:PspC domain-containing protein [Candidatus Magasanikbacteria bacterium]
MKTTISINLGGIAFTIDDDAYRELKQYLDSLSAHFRTEEGGDEIMTDIEARIAEEFSRKRDNGIQVISIAMVQDIISRMGLVEELTGTQATAPDGVTIEDPYFARTDKERVKGDKRLYRDPEQAMLAGVSSGLAAYFSIDPSIPRIIFVLLTFFGGTGILIYIILWLILPEADTPLKQSELRGESPTIKDIEKKFKNMFETGKKKISEIDTEKAKESMKHGFKTTVHTVSRTAGSVGHGLVRIFSIMLGIALMLVGIGGIAGVTIIGTATLFGTSTILLHMPPILMYLGTPIAAVLLISLWCVAVIPLSLLINLGSALVNQRRVRLGFGFAFLSILWIIAISIAGTLIIGTV